MPVTKKVPIVLVRQENPSCLAQQLKMRILLIEDDIKISSFVIQGLKAAGFAVDHVSDRLEGLGRALYEPYDCAIVDLMLPKLDGLTLIEELAAGREYAQYLYCLY